MPTQGPSSKFGFCPRGFINTVCYSTVVICSWVASLSTREGASGGVLLFSWFGEERKGNACCVWVWGARSQIQRKKKPAAFYEIRPKYPRFKNQFRLWVK